MISDMKEKINAISLPAASTIRRAMQAIDRGGLGLALLIEPQAERFVSLVTDGDIRRALLSGHGLESPVSVAQQSRPEVAHVGMSQEKVTSLFSRKVRAVPLLDDSGRVVDIVIFDRRMHLPVAEPTLGEKELLYVTECILTGWISSAGKFVTKFEEMFAGFCGTRHAVTTCNGTTALHLALLALDIGTGDEVIVPSLSFIATANAVMYTGARPVFADSDTGTWGIDTDMIEQLITPQTKAIIPVHLYGQPADMDRILELAGQHNLAVIEDAAEAHGARYKGRRVGGIGDIGTFSFYGNKVITTGEGGMVVTNRDDLAEKIRILRDHGMSRERRYWHTVLGYNYRMTNLQAAVGVAQMEKIESILGSKQTISEAYSKRFKEIPGIQLPCETPWSDNVHWLYSILIDPDTFGHSRDDVISALKNEGIEARPFFPPIHTQPIYNTGQRLPIAEDLSLRGLSVPSAINLSSEDIDHVIEVFRTMHMTGKNNIGPLKAGAI